VAAELVVIKTHGDVTADERFGRTWPVGAFVRALETALLDERIDVAVHSCKDLQTTQTSGLRIAATPVREVANDVLLTSTGVRLDSLPPLARIGTSSPRRAAQILQLGDFEIVPLRGNVPTRIAKMEQQGLDGIVLAAAGLRRLGIDYPHAIDLPTDSFVPAPGQGALAVQVRAGSEASELVTVLEDPPTRAAVTAERCLLREINAGCHTPVGALATVDAGTISLQAQLFSDDYRRCVAGSESGMIPEVIGASLARRLMEELRGRR
jgi:hydroxymethylbilane synthase